MPAPPAGLVRARGSASLSGAAYEAEGEGLRMAPQEIEVVGASIAEVNGVYTIRSPGIFVLSICASCSQIMLCPAAQRLGGRVGESVMRGGMEQVCTAHRDTCRRNSGGLHRYLRENGVGELWHVEEAL